MQSFVACVLSAMEDQAAEEPATKSSSSSGLPVAVNGSLTTLVPGAAQVNSSSLLAPQQQQALSPDAQFDLASHVLYCPVNECSRAAGKGLGFFSQQNLQTVSKSLHEGLAQVAVVLQVSMPSPPQHYNLVHASKNYSCDICHKSFSTVTCFKRHKRECGFDYCCSVCGDKFRLKNSLYMHMKRKGHLTGFSVPREDMDRSGSKIYLQRRRRKDNGTLPETDQMQMEVVPPPHSKTMVTCHSSSAVTANNLDSHSESASVLPPPEAMRKEGLSAEGEAGCDHGASLERDVTDTLYSGLQTLVVEGSESESVSVPSLVPPADSPLPPHTSEQQQQGVDLLKFSLAGDSAGERTFRCSTCLKVYHKRNSLYVHQQRKGHKEGFTVGLPTNNGSSSNTDGEPDAGKPAIPTTPVTSGSPQTSSASQVVASLGNTPRALASPIKTPRKVASPKSTPPVVAGPSSAARVVAAPDSASQVVAYSGSPAAAPVAIVSLTAEPRVFLTSAPQTIVLAPQTNTTPQDLSTRTIAMVTQPQAVSGRPQNLSLGHQVVSEGTRFIANPHLVQSRSPLKCSEGGNQVSSNGVQVGGASVGAEEDSTAVRRQCVSDSVVTPALGRMSGAQQCPPDLTPGAMGEGGGESSSSSPSSHVMQHSIAHQGSCKCQCGMVFADRSTLESHERKYHSQAVTGYKCRVCGKVYLVKNSLTVHQKRKRHSGWVVVRVDAGGRGTGVQRGGALPPAAPSSSSTSDVPTPHTVAPIQAVFDSSPPVAPTTPSVGGGSGYVVVPVLVPANHRLAVLAGSHATPIALLPPPPEEQKKARRGDSEQGGPKRFKLGGTVDVGCQTEGLLKIPSPSPSGGSDVRGDVDASPVTCPSVYVQAGGGLPSDLVGALDLGTQTEWCHLHNVDELLDFGTQTPSFLHLSEQGSQTNCMDVELGVQTETAL